MHPLLAAADTGATPIRLVTARTLDTVLESLPAPARAFAKAAGFEAKSGRHLLLPDEQGAVACVLFAIEGEDAKARDPFLPGKLASLLPEGIYRFAGAPADAELAALGWLLESYSFERYRKRREDAPGKPRLVVPEGVDAARLSRLADAVAMGRDLINTPACDLGPDALEAAARDLAARCGASVRSVVGDDLLEGNFPMIHAVGRAAAIPPRLIDLTWGDEAHPKVTLVGKGVCFDTGGLNIKPDAAMLLMKKDMGGAATALAAGRMVMEAGLPVRLRVLVPAVENAVSGASFRPGDILKSRKGLGVEIGNTDAEGRLVLADALALADEEAPDLVLDFATLTGAARVALGPDLPPLYSDDDALAADIAAAGAKVNDPVWRMPLWNPYDELLASKVTDVNHISSGAFAGSITAALFLRRFVSAAKAWAHFDVFAWTPTAKPGRPFGAEPQVARLVFELLEHRYGG
jgi:leucyl aminopeptidase